MEKTFIKKTQANNNGRKSTLFENKIANGGILAG